MKKIIIAALLGIICFTYYAQAPDATADEEDGYKVNFKKNLIDFNIIDWGYSNAAITYRHYFKNGKIGFAIPFIYRPGGLVYLNAKYKLDDVSFNTFNWIQRFRTGLELDYYPTGQGQLKYFLGPSFQAGLISSRSAIGLPYPSRNDDFFYILGINNGISLQYQKHLNIVLKAHTGMVKINNSRNDFQFVVFLGFHVGYRFNMGKA